MFLSPCSPNLQDSRNFLQQAGDLGTHIICTFSVVIHKSSCFFPSALLLLFISSNAALLEIFCTFPTCVYFCCICWTLLQGSAEALPGNALNKCATLSETSRFRCECKTSVRSWEKSSALTCCLSENKRPRGSFRKRRRRIGAILGCLCKAKIKELVT